MTLNELSGDSQVSGYFGNILMTFSYLKCPR